MRAKGLKQLLSPQQGLVTEQSPLTPVEGSTLSEDNFDFNDDGSKRVRRLGINREATGSFFTLSENITATSATNHYLWESVSNIGGLNFHVFQINSILYFLEDGEGDLYGNLKGFEYDLTNDVTSAYTDTDTEMVDMYGGDGKLFVVGKRIEPIFLEYDQSGDSLSSTQIQIRIRDFTGLDDGWQTNYRPTAIDGLSEEHEYNLRNQGWNQQRRTTHAGAFSDPITTFQSTIASSEYPSNADIAYLGMIDDGSGNLVFDPDYILDLTTGNTAAPKGHFVIDPFYIDYENLRLGNDLGSGAWGGGVGSLAGAGGGSYADPPSWWTPPDGDAF